MDTDDIAEPERFKQQIEFYNKILILMRLVVGFVEIDENDSVINDKVEYPIFHNELYQFLKNEIH